MLEHVESISIPYVSSTREALDLPEDQPALAIFAAHHCQSVLNMHKTNNIHQKICEGLSAIQIMVKVAVEEKYQSIPTYQRKCGQSVQCVCRKRGCLSQHTTPSCSFPFGIVE